MSSSQILDYDEEDPYYKTKELVVELIADKETNTSDTEEDESNKPHTVQTVAQHCELLDIWKLQSRQKRQMNQLPTPITRHASEVDEPITRTPLIDIELAVSKKT